PVEATGVVGNSSDLFRRVTMLLQDPLQVERRCPRWWSVGAAAGLLSLAVLAAGVGVTAVAAPADDKEVVVVVPDPSGEVKADTKKEKGKKGEQGNKFEAFDFDFDLDGVLANLADDETREKVRAELRKAMEQVRKATAELAKERGKDTEEWAKKAAKI